MHYSVLHVLPYGNKDCTEYPIQIKKKRDQKNRKQQKTSLDRNIQNIIDLTNNSLSKQYLSHLSFSAAVGGNIPYIAHFLSSMSDSSMSHGTDITPIPLWAFTNNLKIGLEPDFLAFSYFL